MLIQELFEDAGVKLPQQPTTVVTTPNRVVKWIETNCPKYLKNARASEALIFRGAPNKGATQLGDTSHFKRVSMGSDNFYTMFFASSPKWKEFPSREHAFVGATSPTIADGYGTTYVVFPADDAKIGICPTYDMWFSFKTLQKLSIPSLSSLNSFIKDIYPSGKELPRDGSALREFLRKIKKPQLQKLMDAENFTAMTCEAIEQVIGDRNLEDVLEEALDPKENGFIHTTGADFTFMRIGKGNEVWVEGRAAFVRLDDLTSTPAIKKLFDERLNFSLD